MTQADLTPGTVRTVDAAISDIVGHIGRDSFGTGPLADLRRIDPKSAAQGSAALHRLLARYVPDSWLGGDNLNRWTLLVHLLALGAPDLHRGGAPIGASLFSAGYSEGRLTRLLEARAAELNVVLPRMVRFLVSKSERLQPYELGRLILRGENDTERLRIARDYYRAEARKSEAA